MGTVFLNAQGVREHVRAEDRWEAGLQHQLQKGQREKEWALQTLTAGT